MILLLLHQCVGLYWKETVECFDACHALPVCVAIDPIICALPIFFKSFRKYIINNSSLTIEWNVPAADWKQYKQLNVLGITFILDSSTPHDIHSVFNVQYQWRKYCVWHEPSSYPYYTTSTTEIVLFVCILCPAWCNISLLKHNPKQKNAWRTDTNVRSIPAGIAADTSNVDLANMNTWEAPWEAAAFNPRKIHYS